MNLITRLTSVGHPEACFKARMSAVFVEDHSTITPQLDMLERAAESGHELAMYVLSLVLDRSNSGPPTTPLLGGCCGRSNVTKWARQ